MTSRSQRSNARPQLSERATAHIRGLIMSGELRPGTLVRPETIGEELGISTTPAREALQALRVEGFLQLVPRRGFVVGPLTGEDIRDLFQVQALIGGELAARAAAKATERDVAELEALHHELIAAAARNDHERLEEKNHAFHREINLLADSRKIIWLLGLVTRYVPRQFYSSIPGWPRATMDDHAELLKGIKAKDPAATRVAMHQHIVHSGELLAAHFDARVAAAEAADNEPTYTAQTNAGGGLASA
ncbi:GntR family transcriptional regulator [Arthrobacter sp. FW305-BF8]|nr:GntR family transcriptional regulator [Arthrobacter sp. FW305-BF8]